MLLFVTTPCISERVRCLSYPDNDKISAFYCIPLSAYKAGTGYMLDIVR